MAAHSNDKGISNAERLAIASVVAPILRSEARDIAKRVGTKRARRKAVMAVGDKSRTQGGVMLERRGGSHAEIAAKVGVDKSLVTRWISGVRRPTEIQRSKIKEIYDIPTTEWNELVKIAPAVEPTMPSSDPVEDLDATLQSNAVRLNRMILSDLDRLEGPAGAELELGKRSEILKKLSDGQVALAKATGETAHSVQRYLALPEVKRVHELIVGAIQSYPEALAKVLEVLRANR